MDLFRHARREEAERTAPLAARMRPRTLDEFVGQDHVLGPGRLLRRAIQADQLSSLILCGPPGTGKTTLAMVIANTTRSRFVTLNAVLAGVKDIREVTAVAQEERDLYGRRTILFVDEVHRWNKAQQDALLPWVENGTIVMIGATTENPWFSVNRALLSRSRVFQLVPLTEEPPRGGRAALSDPSALRECVERSRGAGSPGGRGERRRALPPERPGTRHHPRPPASGRITIDMAVAEESISPRRPLRPGGRLSPDTISRSSSRCGGPIPTRPLLAGQDGLCRGGSALSFAAS